MKRLSTVFILFLFLNLSAQDYQEMVIEGATWIYEKKETGPVSYFAYHIKGDTTINNVDYKILNSQGLDISPDGLLSLNSNSTPLAYLREDIDSKKVYTLIDEATEYNMCFGVTKSTFKKCHVLGEYENEFLLYDFSLEVGDIIESEVSVGIFAIESSELYGVEVDLFVLDGGQPYYEKFGYEQGLYFPFSVFFLEGYSRLIQYCETDNLECEVLIEPLSNLNLESSEFKIFPNPAHSLVTIEVPNDIIQSLKVFAMDGRLLIKNDNIDLSTINLDLSSVNYEGIIIIEGTTKNSKFQNRVLKY